MKKLIVPILILAMAIPLFACGNSGSSATDTTVNYSWPAEQWLKGIPKYTAGNISYATEGDAVTVSVTDTDYEDFTKYIGKLKKDGFVFYNNTGIEDVEENYELKGGRAEWTCTNETVYMSIQFIDNSYKYFDRYNCNVRIYTYSQKPATW